jgi:predicted esterase
MLKPTSLFVALVATTWLGCDDGNGPDPGEDLATALFVVPRDGVAAAEFYSLPFPNDLHLDDAGHPALAGYPRPIGLLGTYADAMAKLDGWGTNAAVFQRFSTAIDPTSLPADGAATTAETASVYLVDVDPDSPARGTRHPLRLKFTAAPAMVIGPNWLAALPYPGFPLREGTTYALVVTERVYSTDRIQAVADADFTAVLTPAAGASDPAIARAQARYAPFLDWLDEPGGDERADVISAAVFTTQSATAIMADLRTAIHALPAPVAADVERLTFGSGAFALYHGTYQGPNFQTGEVPYRLVGGDITVGGDGLPVVQRMETLRFALTVPPGPTPANGWPVAIYAHGTGGDYQSFVNDGTAGRLAAQGLATISIDQVLHGPRNPGGNPELDFFNFQNPDAGRNNAIQGALDNFALVRLLEGFRFSETEPEARTITFDPTKITFFGHSQGGLTGPPFIAYEPRVRAAVLSGAGGLLYYALLNKTEPVDITAVVRGIISDDPLDEFNPALALLQTWIERSDTINYGPLLVREPPGDLPPMDIFQTMGFIDHFTPVPNIGALAVAIGGDLVAPRIEAIPGFELRGGTTATAPITGNRGGRTSVVAQYPATGGDGHFVVFNHPAGRVQSAEFLGSFVRTGTATVVAPPQ